MADERHKEIGGRKRAQSRYQMIVYRLQHTEKQKNRHYEGISLLVGKEEFVSWFQARDFNGASVDRIDSKGHYELSNMQVIDLAENIRKDKLLARDGKTRCRTCSGWFDLKEFCPDKERSLGVKTICLSCERTRVREAQRRLRARRKQNELCPQQLPMAA